LSPQSPAGHFIFGIDHVARFVQTFSQGSSLCKFVIDQFKVSSNRGLIGPWSTRKKQSTRKLSGLDGIDVFAGLPLEKHQPPHLAHQHVQRFDEIPWLKNNGSG